MPDKSDKTPDDNSESERLLDPNEPGEAVDNPPPDLPALSAELEAQLREIKEQIEAEQKLAAAAAEAEEGRNSQLLSAKAQCSAICGPISAHLQAATDERERAALIAMEERAHAPHASALEAEYLTFAGQREGESNPAKPGETNALGVKVAVAQETGS